MTISRRACVQRAIVATAAALLVAASAAAYAQGYPSRPIRLIVPFGPGGGSDYVGRVVAQKLTEQMGRRINFVR